MAVIDNTNLPDLWGEVRAYADKAAGDASALSRSAAGDSITATGAASAPLLRLGVEGESEQDGTPAPESPQEIRCVRGRNLFDKDSMILLVGARLSYTNRNVYQNENTANYSVTTYIPVIGGSQYAFSGDIENICWYSSASASSGLSTDTKAGTHTAPAEALYCMFEFTSNSADLIQLELGSTATPYVPYGSIGVAVTQDGATSVTPIPLQGHELHSLPDGTHDELSVDAAGHVGLVKRIGKSSTVIGIYTSSDLLKNVALLNYNMDNDYQKMSNYFRKFENSGAVPIGYIYGGTAGTSGIAGTCATIPPSITTVAEFQAAYPDFYWIYPITPITHDLGYIDMPQVTDGATVEVLAEVTPEVEGEWWTEVAQPAASLAAAFHALGLYVDEDGDIAQID